MTWNQPLEKAVPPHTINRLKDGTQADLLLRDLAVINEFLFYVEAEPFITPEKAENYKRMAFKKTSTV